MRDSHDSGVGSVRRRALLTAAATGAAGLAGCLRQFRSTRQQRSPEQLSLEIHTLAGDYDARATEIGRTLSDNLSAVGVDTELVLLPEDELRRETLISQEYDLFVSRHPDIRDPDFLRPLLHSSFASEIGWQNPFNFTDFTVDELVVQQKEETGIERRGTVAELQHELARQQPFVPIAVPDHISTTRSTRFGDWQRVQLQSPLSLLQLEARGDESEQLRLVTTDDRITRNLNPLAVEYRSKGTITQLLYDSLGRRYDGKIRPWAASDWEFEQTGTGPVATVTLDPSLQWHNGESLTADDVAFTIEFLQDTSLGAFDVPVPAPQFRGRTSLIDTVDTVDDEVLEIHFAETTPEIAVRSMTLPIVPRAEWEEKINAPEVAGIELSETLTEALVWNNDEPIGSGPFVFDSREEGQELHLKRYDDHFLTRKDGRSEELATAFPNGVPFERISLTSVRSDSVAVQLLKDDEADSVLTNLDSSTVPSIGREQEIELHVNQSQSLYLVGCNTSREPLGNPHFRRVIARLLDKESLVSNVFGGFATPAASPLSTTTWLAPEFEWNGTDPELPFFGTEGELDVEAARQELREIGFSYSSDDELLEQ